MDGDALVIETTALLPGHTYALEAADVEDGPWDAVQAGITSDKPARTTLTVPSATRQFYRLSE